MRSSAGYWDARYKLGLTSGSGSEGVLVTYKAGVLNEFVASRGVESVLELGCGDGQQLAHANYPRYLGLDVSPRAIELCEQRFAGTAGRSFLWYDPAHSHRLGEFVRADLGMSLDVIYHLVEDAVYDRYLDDLFSLSRRHVIVYSSNKADGGSLRHVRHRPFVADVAARFPEFRLTQHLPNPHRELSFADFYFFEREPAPAGSTSRA
jgi:SAM-dependent methyltransferase